MILHTTSNAPQSARESSGSRLAPLPNPDLTFRNPGEQAVIVKLQVVANCPDPSDFVQAIQQTLPGMTAYLRATAKPLACARQVPTIESLPMEAEATDNTREAKPQLVAGPSDEAGQRRSPQEAIAPTAPAAETASPNSSPPPDKQWQSETPQSQICAASSFLYTRKLITEALPYHHKAPWMKPVRHMELQKPALT